MTITVHLDTVLCVLKYLGVFVGGGVCGIGLVLFLYARGLNRMSVW